MTENKKVQEERFQKRQALKDLSTSLIAMRDRGEYMGNEDDTVNGLLRFYYACKGLKNLKTFKEWKKGGFIVKKGEKSLLVWGSPVSSKAEKERVKELKKEGKEEEAKDDFFPICHLFAESQVRKIES